MRARLALVVLMLLAFLPATAQESPITRDQTRELLRSSLERYGPLSDVNINFRQSEKQPYNFVGMMTTGLKNSRSWRSWSGSPTRAPSACTCTHTTRVITSTWTRRAIPPG